MANYDKESLILELMKKIDPLSREQATKFIETGEVPATKQDLVDAEKEYSMATQAYVGSQDDDRITKAFNKVKELKKYTALFESKELQKIADSGGIEGYYESLVNENVNPKDLDIGKTSYKSYLENNYFSKLYDEEGAAEGGLKMEYENWKTKKDKVNALFDDLGIDTDKYNINLTDTGQGYEIVDKETGDIVDYADAQKTTDTTEGTSDTDQTTDTTTDETETIPEPYKYTPTEEMEGVKKSYADLVEEGETLGEFQEPEFTGTLDVKSITPEQVENWNQTLGEWEKVADTEAEEQLLARINKADPYGGGSGDRAKLLSKLVAERETARRERAMTYAGQEVEAQNLEAQTKYEQEYAAWEKTYGTAWAQYEYKQQQIENAKTKLLEIEQFEANADKYTSEKERDDAWRSLERTWQERDNQLQTQFELELQGRTIAANVGAANLQNTYNTQATDTAYEQQQALLEQEKQNALEIAKEYDNESSSFLEDLIGVGSTVIGYKTGGSIYDAISSIFKSSAKTKSETGDTGATTSNSLLDEKYA